MKSKNNIRKKRMEKGMTLEAVATLMHTSKQTVQRYESGKIATIPTHKLELLANLLDTTPIYLMGWETQNKSEKLITIEEALQALGILERYAYQTSKRKTVVLNDKDYQKLLEDVIGAINSKAEQAYMEQTVQNEEL